MIDAASNLHISAGHDLTLTGSNVASDAGTTLSAGNDVKIVASIDTQTTNNSSKTSKSGLFGTGGAGFTYGTQQQTADATQTSQSANASNVGATSGNVVITAGNLYRQEGSNVTALAGDIGISGKKVEIVETQQASSSTQQSEFKQSGITVAVSAPVISALQTAQQMKQAASQTSDKRVQALAGGATALAAVNNYDAMKADPQNAGGVSVSITYGQSKNESKTTQSGSTAAGSKVAAGGDVIIKATGAGADSNLTVQGSDIKGGGNVLLKADGTVNLLAASNTNEQHSDSSNQSAGVGVAITYGKNGFAAGITANAALGKGGSDGTDQSWTNSHISAGKTVGIDSGGDTNIKGAVVSGNQVVANVGGNLNIESLQDTHKYDSKDQQVSGSVTVGYGFSASANASQQKMNSDYASVMEQSGIRAGDGGFQVNVKGNTDLKGAVVESSQAAIDNKANSFTTGTLTYSDIENYAHYSATSVGIGGGYSQGGGGMKQLSEGDGGSASSGSNNGGVGKTQDGDVASAGTKVPGSGNKSGFSTGTPIVMAATGDSGSITRSGISAGSLTITDEAGQLAKTGKTAAETLASLDTSVSTDKDTTGALKPIFDKTQIEAGFTVAKELINQTGTYVNNRVTEAQTAKTKATDPDAKNADGSPLTPIQRADLLTEANQLESDWGPGGTYRRLAGAITAGLSGNVTGGTAAMVETGAINYLQGLGTTKVKELANALGDENARAALQGIVGCAGAAASNQSCAAGALGASASVVLNNLLDQATKSKGADLSATDKEDRTNTVQTILAGISVASGLSADAGTVVTTGRTETENNATLTLKPGVDPMGYVFQYYWDKATAKPSTEDLLFGKQGPAFPDLGTQTPTILSTLSQLVEQGKYTKATLLTTLAAAYPLNASMMTSISDWLSAVSTLVQPAHQHGNTSPPGQNVPATDKNKGVLVNNAIGQNGATILANPGQTSTGNGIIATPNNGPITGLGIIASTGSDKTNPEGNQITPAPAGVWTSVNESMPQRARDYQQQITGSVDQAYVIDGVKFDGVSANGTLLETKGPGYAQFVDKNGEFKPWFAGAAALVEQATRQSAAAKGATVEWIVAEPVAANAIQRLLKQNGVGGIKVIYTKPKVN
ncbi:hemagglutinin repeat-containing protein [Amantichitinum ursilacus]|uniref:Filamentous hemagglutinin n=1 Tax=Amantichitinum ursilacus TaxID=857265 RepID=A0A0N1JSK0_9NEIS|nr:hemagglutinin repeat-containing protein [Amantichitinum ursilacus]KPC53159.1 Filamentous hemagglutinin [Amantichitinum ursilacus]